MDILEHLFKKHTIDWPVPKEAVTNDTAEGNEKLVAPKVKSKGQWKPLTPTLVHPGRKSRSTAQKKPEGRREPKQQKDNKPVTNSEHKSPQKKEEKKASAHTSKPRNRKPMFNKPYRKAPAYVTVDAETLKFYIMQQM